MSEQDAGPGSILQAEREALGVTLREVSETLNLSIAIIEAIEADEYQRLPGPVFGRGYVRAYARLLDLDPEPLLARYPRHEEGSGAVSGSSEASVREWIRRRPALVLGVAVAVVLLVTLLAALWLWPAADPDGERVALRPAAAADAAGQLRADRQWDTAEGAATLPVPTEQGGDEALDPYVDPDADSDPYADADADADPYADGAPAVAPLADSTAAGTVRRITATGDARLKFRFSADCWVQIRDSAGADLYSDLGRAGSDLDLVGQGPFRIRLGYGPGVQLEFNGEAVPLGPHTRNNIATLVLGQ
ncbi:MAG: helix-turn-helix domain-containing protein [Pseudomonadales bacterium]